jgi:hypothetical protein
MTCGNVVGGTRFELVASSVSGNSNGRSCFRVIAVTCCEWSTGVCWRPRLSGAIVTQLVTHYRHRSCPPEWCHSDLDSRFSNLISAGSRVIIHSMTAEGTVYLLHFERPYKGRSRHYLGFTRNLEQRLENHRRGTACATTRLAFDRGIGFTLARTWPGTPKLEREIKSSGVVKCCPICPPRPAPSLPRPT